MSQAHGSGGSGGGDTILMGAIIGTGIASGAVWVGAQLASLVHSGETLGVSPSQGFKAMVHLPANAGDPRFAWDEPAASQLPGPVLYWLATGLVVAVALALVGVVLMRFTGTSVGTDRSDRLGTSPRAHLARRRDLKPLIVAKPTRGRFVLGRVGRHLVATEDRLAQSSRAQRDRERTRVGDRSAVVVVGPSRCGKTANVTAGILDWQGPAILSSVKDDLYRATVKRRRQLGRVFVFDPFGELGEDLGPEVELVSWSPLQGAVTISGAQQAASTLLDAGATEGVTNANYWSTKGQQLLWPMLFAAAVTGRSMGDVVRWMTLQDGNTGTPGEVAEVLSEVVRSTDGRTAAEAKQALTAFTGFWLLDARTRSDIFSTAQTVITAWEDPFVAAASATKVETGMGSLTRNAMDMRMLLGGNNTLYLVQPLKSVERFAVVFGGLLGALLRDQAYEISKRAGEPIPPTLAVIDEAGNTPLRWLPDVASTCSGIGIQLVTVWQSLAQMRAIYQAQTDSLLTNHGSKIFFSGLSDRETLDYASHLGGDEEVAQQSTSSDVGWSSDRRSVALSTTRVKLLPPDLLRQVPPGSALLLHGTLPPAHLIGRRPWEDRRLRKLAEGLGPKVAAPALSSGMKRALTTESEVSPFVLAHMAAMVGEAKPEAVKVDDVKSVKAGKSGKTSGPVESDVDQLGEEDEEDEAVHNREDLRRDEDKPESEPDSEIDEPVEPDVLEMLALLNRRRQRRPSPGIER